MAQHTPRLDDRLMKQRTLDSMVERIAQLTRDVALHGSSAQRPSQLDTNLEKDVVLQAIYEAPPRVTLQALADLFTQQVEGALDAIRLAIMTVGTSARGAAIRCTAPTPPTPPRAAHAGL